MARIADSLTEAGHNVTFFTPILDETRRSQLGVKLTTDVLVLEIFSTAPCTSLLFNSMLQQDDEMRRQIVPIDEIMDVFWTTDITSSNAPLVVETFHKLFALSCGNLFRNEEVIEHLHSRDFDVAVIEPFHSCGLALFRHIGIEKVVLTSSCVNYDILIPTTGEPEDTSYVPAMISQVTDKMSLVERLENYKIFHVMKNAFETMFDDEAIEYRKHLGKDFPDWRQLIPDASLHLVNSIPYIDFPRPSIQKTIPIGGISVGKIESLSSIWDDILNLRDKNMFISFGSLVKSSQMPMEFKHNLLEVFKSEPNVTFIWKYESDDLEFAKEAKNVVFVKWAPQAALLNDVRLTAFFSHGGLGSTNEAAHFGVPTIMLPLFAEQPRNSNMLARLEMAIVLQKSDLSSYEKVQTAVSNILYDKKYMKNAKRIADMLQNQPSNPKDTAVKSIAFVARYGPFHHMTPYSLQMPWYQRHNYDIYLLLVIPYLFCSILIFVSLRRFVMLLPVKRSY